MTEKQRNFVFYRRLNKLADFLETVPKERFRYDVWVGKDWKGKPDLSCGTRACAAGWATTMPEFRRLGLRLEYTPGAEWQYVINIKSKEVYNKAVYALEPIFGPLSESVFVPVEDFEEKLTPKQVAKKIRRLIQADKDYNGYED